MDSSLGTKDPENHTLADIQEMKEVLKVQADNFGKKLGEEVRLFIHNTRTVRDQIKAIMRCFTKCTTLLNEALKNVGISENVLVVPAFNDSTSKDKLRSNAGKMNKMFQNQSLESFLTTCSAYYETCVEAHRYDDAERVILAQKRVLEKCEVIIDRVLHKGYDCKTSSEEEDDDYL